MVIDVDVWVGLLAIHTVRTTAAGDATIARYGRLVGDVAYWLRMGWVVIDSAERTVV